MPGKDAGGTLWHQRHRNPAIRLTAHRLEGIKEAKWGSVTYSACDSWKQPLYRFAKSLNADDECANDHVPNCPIPPPRLQFLLKNIPLEYMYIQRI